MHSLPSAEPGDDSRPATVTAFSGWLAAIFGMGLATAILFALSSKHINNTTVALALLLVVLFIAMQYGSRQAILAAIMGMLFFNFFFLPPVGKLTIADPQNWIALAAFLVTAITVGQLSARARQRAQEAETRQTEIERLYRELQEAFERASEAEALRRSEQLKSALLDAVTHDLRTPLTAIKVSVTSLLDELSSETTANNDPEGRREMLDVINEEADRLNIFIQGLVELARIEAGTLELSQRWSSFDDIIAAALSRAEPRTRGHRLTVDIEPDLPVVMADARALAEVVHTLVDNAAKYSPPGAPIRIAARQLAPGRIEVSVEDEGPGISPELRERVFEKFFRIADQAKIIPPPAGGRVASGLGMGLAIARGIISAHCGTIRVEEGANGKGARFIFTLPTGDDEQALDARHSPRR